MLQLSCRARESFIHFVIAFTKYNLRDQEKDRLSWLQIHLRPASVLKSLNCLQSTNLPCLKNLFGTTNCLSEVLHKKTRRLRANKTGCGVPTEESVLVAFVINAEGFGQGTLTLILKGDISVHLTSLYLLVRNRLHQEKLRFLSHFQKHLILTNKDQEVSQTDTSPFFKGESSLVWYKLLVLSLRVLLPGKEWNQDSGDRQEEMRLLGR